MIFRKFSLQATFHEIATTEHFLFLRVIAIYTKDWVIYFSSLLLHLIGKVGVFNLGIWRTRHDVCKTLLGNLARLNVAHAWSDSGGVLMTYLMAFSSPELHGFFLIQL